MKLWWNVCAALASAAVCMGQTDPGPRGGPAGAGGPYSGLNGNEQAFFAASKAVFAEVDSVRGTLSGEAGRGLGPTFNGNSCAQCHAQPATGGTSPARNPQVALATLHGADNSVPSFITINGPVREARFILSDPNNPNSALDGGVHGLFTIQGRFDAPGCTLAQPNFTFQLSKNNVSFRIPTPTFGLGLVEATPDSVLQANMAANAQQKSALGITGRLNTTGNDGSVTRFGWKAQNKSLEIFAGEAYNVEQGVSNEIFPNERSAVLGCVYNTNPEDHTNIGTGGAATLGDVSSFAGFMRLSAPPQPTTDTQSETNGRSLFNSVGCVLCHSSSLTTGGSPFTGMSNTTYHPYSDFALHQMGSGLADGIQQGTAAADEFRTAPLWGLGQRVFFLHDGRTTDLLKAILAHSSDCGSRFNTAQFRPQGCSEANGVIQNFQGLSRSQQQDILNFLRSL
jgi:CxxC motif-containing protein (DUF1111 family)